MLTIDPARSTNAEIWYLCNRLGILAEIAAVATDLATIEARHGASTDTADVRRRLHLLFTAVNGQLQAALRPRDTNTRH